MATNNNWRATIPEDRRYLTTIASRNLFYGTAWKGEDTANLVYLAIKAGFRSIATAAQPKHYREDLVGEGVRRAIRENIVTREDLYVSQLPNSLPDLPSTTSKPGGVIRLDTAALWDYMIQTTFTPFHSQDPENCPYDARLGIAQQVNASIQTSRQYFADPLTNRPGYLDAVILHDLYPVADETATVWGSMSGHLGQAGGVERLGLSNVDKFNLEWICALHEHHLNTYACPVVVQNRFHQGNDYDAEIRALCQENRITYQAYGVRANNNMLNHESSIVPIADKANVSREAALYGMVMNALGRVADDQVSLDVQVVTGTSNRTRLAVLKQVRQVLMDLNDAHWWNVARLEQRRDAAADHAQVGELTDGAQEKKSPGETRASPSIEANLGPRVGGNVYRLARHNFLEGLRTED